jgi:hypothetical protein
LEPVPFGKHRGDDGVENIRLEIEVRERPDIERVAGSLDDADFEPQLEGQAEAIEPRTEVGRRSRYPHTDHDRLSGALLPRYPVIGQL